MDVVSSLLFSVVAISTNDVVASVGGGRVVGALVTMVVVEGEVAGSGVVVVGNVVDSGVVEGS